MSMDSTHKLELVDKAIQKLLAEKKNKQDDTDQLLLSRLLSELEMLKEGISVNQSDVSIDQEKANSPSADEERFKEHKNGSSSEIIAEEIVKELKIVKRQNMVTHCLLSAVIVLTLAWQISEVSLILKFKDGLSHPFKSFGSMVFGMFRFPGRKAQDGDKQQQEEGSSSRPSVHMPELPHPHMPELPHVDLGLNGHDRK
ncbi:hypothetical protein JCGZ_17981 [Jatropha curcas]|uniref:Uncharacterized protein n=1 Tax=Jatropha curcas TaxID=180498 RepID=A0A067JVK1_JATCU|nr:hypothetical protein JCGZ_17981 [Jatropha curcas]